MDQLGQILNRRPTSPCEICCIMVMARIINGIVEYIHQRMLEYFAFFSEGHAIKVFIIQAKRIWNILFCLFLTLFQGYWYTPIDH